MSLPNCIIRAKVPACEIQAILFSIFETSVYSSDLFRLIRIHLEDGGAIGEISPITLGHLADTGISIINKQLDLMERLGEGAGVNYSVIDLSSSGIHDAIRFNKPISKEYKEDLEREAILDSAEVDPEKTERQRQLDADKKAYFDSLRERAKRPDGVGLESLFVELISELNSEALVDVQGIIEGALALYAAPADEITS